MEANIGGFREITGQVLTDLGQLARSFDEHGQELAKAATEAFSALKKQARRPSASRRTRPSQTSMTTCSFCPRTP